ncbi:MAG: RluA family pseudouridine synthase [Clostridia bacterium]|nr:RluA family pseudouridine synthase [Clostridia bacterium]
MLQESEYRISGDGRRADVLLSEETGLSRSRVAALMAAGRCLMAGKPCLKAGTKTVPGQELLLTVPPPEVPEPRAEDLPLEILYQDADLAVVIKPRGMVVHPAPGHAEGTLVNALLFHMDSLGGIGGELRPGIVHRLDKDTSGLMMVAVHDRSQIALSRMLSERKVEKHYLALVEGKMKESRGRIELPIGRSKKDRKKMAVDPEGREAVTEWNVLAEGRTCTLLDVHILTGRTHQIRVHMKAAGHPLCGDPVYGWEKGTPVPCLMLHAFSLAFDHPMTGESMRFQAPLPEDFMEGLRRNGITVPTLPGPAFAEGRDPQPGAECGRSR